MASNNDTTNAPEEREAAEHDPALEFTITTPRMGDGTQCGDGRQCGEEGAK